MVETLKSRAGRVGLTFLSRINTSLDTGIYSCNKCNNHMLLKHANIALSSENNYSCKKCSELRLEDLVKNIGAIWLTKGRPYNEDSEFILKCGHRKNMRLSSINSWCPVCHNEKLSAEAIEQGIEFLPEIKPSKIDNKVYKLKCGCIKNLSPPRVKEGAFECKIHDKRILDFSRNGYVYLVELKLPDITVLKVGFTLDVSGKGCRYVRYGVSKECVKPIREIKFDDGNFAYDSERLIHRKYKHLRVDSSILRNNLKNGFTECYPIELKDTLIEELERLNV